MGGMQIRRNASNVNPGMPVPFWLLVAGTCVALALAALTFTTGTVQAYALLSVPTATAPASGVTSPTPALAQPDKTKDVVPGAELRGVASWYGPHFDGRTTASGERFDMYGLTAAQSTLPFGTKVRVVNTANHKSVVVRITDRGYLPHKRVLDLSYGAAKKLAMTKVGLAQVKIEVLQLGEAHGTR